MISDRQLQRTVMIAYRGDEQALAVTLRVSGQPRDIARWKASDGELIESEGNSFTLREALYKIEEILKFDEANAIL